MLKWLIVFAAWAALAVPAAAQEPSAELTAGAGRVVALLRGQVAPAEIFSPEFLAQVPEAQVRSIVQSLAAQYGPVRALGTLRPLSAQAGAIDVAFERAVVHMNIAVAPQPPHRITGLLITGADLSGDTMAAVLAELRALPGQTGVAVARLGDGAPALTASIEPDRPLAIGSAFKLWILAELSRQIGAGQHHWSDVVPLDRRSIPGGALASWPPGAPVTLHTLASLMISQSDNTATDVLLHALGRDNVERMMAAIGVEAAARNRPLLSTLEMAAIKTGPAAGFNAWQQADEAGRRQMLANAFAGTDAARVDVARFAGNPLHIDSVEWFASAADMVRTMDWLRRNADESARAILAINTGLGPLAGEYAYAGYKGGSEPGVINLTWLVRARSGAWYVVTGSWNNPAAPVEDGRFAAIMVRAVQQLGR